MHVDCRSKTSTANLGLFCQQTENQNLVYTLQPVRTPLAPAPGAVLAVVQRPSSRCLPSSASPRKGTAVNDAKGRLTSHVTT